MSRQSRPESHQKPVPGDKAEAAPDPAATVRLESSSGTEDAPAAPSAKAKLTKLPAFGFASDLLANRSSATERETSPPLSETRGEAPVADGGAIFAFADSLSAAEKDEERRIAEARITTWITFDLAGETFAVPVEPVREVLRIHNITRVPHAPHPIRGVTNLRGRVIPVIDLRRRVGLPEGELDRLARIIIVASRGRLIGLLVDQVHQVMHLDLNLVQPPPDDVMTLQSDYILGVYHLGDQLLLLLDVDRALTIRDDSEAQISGAA